MSGDLIEAGCFVNTHGIHGMLRLQPWADSPEQLKKAIDASGLIYVGAVPHKVLSAAIHKSFLLICLEGTDSIDAAVKFKNKKVCVKRDDFKLEDGTYFITDLIGIKAIDADTGSALGCISDILTLPAHNVYIIKNADGQGKEREILIPAVPEFIVETNLKDGFVKINVIDGL